jgi:CBS domain-containing protein
MPAGLAATTIEETKEGSMRVKEIMTPDVATIAPEASVRDVAALLVERGIAGVPVVDTTGRLLGVVSEADILYKEHDPTQPRRGPLGWLAYGATGRAVTKANAVTVGDAMTAPAITISPTQSVAEAARLMTERRVNRLPVVRGEKLVGIVTRADLVRAFTRPDADIEREIRQEIVKRVLWLEPDSLGLEVSDGTVVLSGELATKSDALVLERLVARVPGVVAQRSLLTWRDDDTGRRTAAVTTSVETTL